MDVVAGARVRRALAISTLKAAVAVLALVAAVGAVAAPARANSPDGNGAIIDNGVVQLGVNDWGNLNFYSPAGQPSEEGDSIVGLRLLRDGQPPLEATADGCTCEGWGIADGASGLEGGANDSSGRGYFGLQLVNSGFASDAQTATSTMVTTGSASSAPASGPSARPELLAAGDPSLPTLQVKQEYHPSPASPYLYEAQVTVTNVGDVTAGDVRYRRTMDWDIEPTAFDEYSTIDGLDTANLLESSDDGFSDSSPLSPPNPMHEPQCTGTDPLDSTVTDLCTGFFTDAGPADHGAQFDFGLGALAPGQSKTFTIFYGAAPNEAAALDALHTGGAEVWSLGQADVDNGASLGVPATFIFGFRTASSGDLSGAAPAMTLSAPSAPGVTPAGDPNAFDVSASLHNYGAKSATQVTTTLNLPAGLTLGSGANPVVTRTLPSGGNAAATWHVQPAAQCSDQTYTVSATTSWAESDTRTLHSTRTVHVHGTCGRIYGVLAGFDRGGIQELGGADVDLCPAAGDCSSPIDQTTTSATGQYSFLDLAPGTYQVVAHGIGSFTNPATQTSAAITIGKGTDAQRDFSWDNITPVDAHTSLGGAGLVDVENGYPTVYYGSPWTLRYTGCPAGTTKAEYQILSASGATFQDWTDMGAPASDGSFTTTVPVLEPDHGDAAVHIRCDGTETTSFDLYIDPSGVVVDQTGKALPGATVTLYRFQSDTLGYVKVPNGSAVMSPANRHNPDTTDKVGHFGWDVVAGGYVVRAAKAGCHLPGSASTPYVESAAMTIPPEVTDLRLQLDCTPAPNPPTPTPTPTPTPKPMPKPHAKPLKGKVSSVKVQRSGKVAKVAFKLKLTKAGKVKVGVFSLKGKKVAKQALKLAKGAKIGHSKVKGRTPVVKLKAGTTKVQLVYSKHALRKHHRYQLRVLTTKGKVLAKSPLRG